MATYFTSDLHFGHANILKYDNNNFVNIHEHDDFIIKKWNEKVTDEDDVYILGDVGLTRKQDIIDIFKILKGKKHLIIGNHDSNLIKLKDFTDLFVEIVPYKELPYKKGVKIVLSHYPILFFKNWQHGWLHLYGHVHQSKEFEMVQHFQELIKAEVGDKPKMANVGCVEWDYQLVTLEEIEERHKW